MDPERCPDMQTALRSFFTMLDVGTVNWLIIDMVVLRHWCVLVLRNLNAEAL